MRANKAGWGDREMGGSAAPLIRWHSEAWMKWGRELRRHQSTGGLWIITAECGGLTEIIFKRKTWRDRGNTENILSSFQYFLVYILCERQMAASEEPLKQSRFLLLGVLLWVGEQKREEDTEMHMHMCVCTCMHNPHTQKAIKDGWPQPCSVPCDWHSHSFKSKGNISWFSEVCSHTHQQGLSMGSLAAKMWNKK